MLIEGVNGSGIGGMPPISRPTFPGLAEGVSLFFGEIPARLLPFTGVTRTGGRDDTSSSVVGKLREGSTASFDSWLPVDDVSPGADKFWLSDTLPGALGSFLGESVIGLAGEWRDRNQRMTPRWTPRSPEISEVSKRRKVEEWHEYERTYRKNVGPSQREHGEHVHYNSWKSTPKRTLDRAGTHTSPLVSR